MPQPELTFSTAVQPGGKIELVTSFPEGSRVEVVVIPADQKTDNVSELVAAAGSSLDFWDNPQDDEDWNKAYARATLCWFRSLSPKERIMAQLKKVVEPFGEVNVYPADGGKTRVVATILMEPHREGAQTGIALDGSGSMAKLYGVDDGSGGGFFASLFGLKKELHNEITPVAQKLCAYLARKIDADGGTTCVYWATGTGGSKIEVIGDLTADAAERHIFGPPRDFGTGTQLLPAVKYFVERFKDAPWGFYVFITDGELHDLQAVKDYSTRLAHEVSAKRRNPLKFVLIGIGPEVNEGQMEELDDLDTGTEVDLWDHKLAAEMRVLQEIFAEVVDKNARISDGGRILDPSGKVVKDYSDTGMTGFLEFEVPAGVEYFTLEVNGNKVNQGLTDHALVPPSQMAR